MSVTVVGSIAFDAVKTPFGQRERILGGSAVHFALAASFFADVRVVELDAARMAPHRAPEIAFMNVNTPEELARARALVAEIG
jgi:hypothetical protein